MQQQILGKLVLASLLTVAVVFGLKTPAQASLINASQVLGQLDIHGNPSFTQSNPDSTIVNNYGFDHAANMVIDSVRHRLFVADTQNNRVLVFNLPTQNIPLDFKIGDFQADYVLGQNNFSDNLPNQGLPSRTDSSLSRPTGLAYYADADMLYVVDRENFRVMAYDVSTIDNGESAVSVIRAGSANNLELYVPSGLALDSSNRRLFLSDSMRNRVLVYDLTNLKGPVAVLGQTDFTSAESGITAANLDYPTALAFNEQANALYVADAGNSRILVFNLEDGIDNGEDAVAVLGQTDFTSDVINLNPPTASGVSGMTNFVSSMSFDPVRNLLYVPISIQNRVMVFDVSTIDNGEDAIYVLGQNNFTSIGQNQYGSVSPTSLSEPTGVAIVDDYLYIADSENNRIVIYDMQAIDNGEPAIEVLGQLDGNGVPIFTQNTINSATINNHGFKTNSFSTYANGIAADLVSHRLFVADVDNNRVLVFNLDGSDNLIDHTADNVLGQIDFLSGKANRGGSVGANTLSGPTSLVFDPNHNYLYVSDKFNNRVLMYDVSTITNGENAVNVLGQTNFNTNNQGIIGANSLLFPAGLTLNTTDNILFVADQSNHRVLVFDATVITNGENAVNVLGQTNFTDRAENHGGGVDAVGFVYPTGIAFNEGNKNLYVADGFNNNRVLVFDTTQIINGESAIHVLGQANFTDNFPNRSAGFTLPNAETLAHPTAAAYDPATNNLYVSDSFNNRVLAYDLTVLADGMAATAVLGQTNFTELNQVGNGQARFYSPNGLVKLNDKLYVVDAQNNRVMEFDSFLNLPNTTLPNGTVGFPYYKVIDPAFNNRGTLTYTISGGNFPSDLSFDPTTRVISGIPSTAGAFTFTITAKDILPNGEFFVASKEFTIVVVASNGPANLNIIACTENTACADASVGSKIVAPQTNNVQLGKWKFAAANSNVTLQKLTLQTVDPATNMPLTMLGNFITLSLYDGQTLLATGNYVNSNLVFSGFNSVISNGSSKTYTLKGSTNVSGSFSSNKLVAFVIKSDSMVDIQAKDAAGAALVSARINHNAVTNNGPVEFRFARATVYNFHDAFPVIFAGSVGNSLVLSSQAKVFKFTVTNAGVRDLRLAQAKVSVNISGLAQGGSISDFRLYEDNGVGGLGTNLAQNNVVVSGNSIIAFNQTNDLNSVLENLVVAPGASRTFIVTANTANILTNLVPGSTVRVSAKIAGTSGWNGNSWNTGNLFYYYTPVFGSELGQFSASDSYGPSGQIYAGDLTFTL